MSALQSATWLRVFPGLLFLWMFVLLIPEFIPQAFGMPLSQVIANDRAYKLKQDSQRDEHKDASDFVASLLPFGNKRQNKELSSSNSSLSSTSETPNESTSPNTPEPAPRPRRRVSWPVFSLTLKLGQRKSSKVILWVLAYVKPGNTVCVQVSVNNPVQGEYAVSRDTWHTLITFPWPLSKVLGASPWVPMIFRTFYNITTDPALVWSSVVTRISGETVRLEGRAKCFC